MSKNATMTGTTTTRTRRRPAMAAITKTEVKVNIVDLVFSAAVVVVVNVGETLWRDEGTTKISNGVADVIRIFDELVDEIEIAGRGGVGDTRSRYEISDTIITGIGDVVARVFGLEEITSLLDGAEMIIDEEMKEVIIGRPVEDGVGKTTVDELSSTPANIREKQNLNI